MKRARRLLEHVTDVSSTADAWTNLGIVEAQLGQRERAEACWQTAVGLDKRCARAFYQLGSSRRTRAEALLAQVRPGSRHAERRQAEARALLESAAEALAQAAAAAPGNGVLHQILADVETGLGKTATVEKARADAKRLDPLGVSAVWERASLSSLVLPGRPRPLDTAQLPLHFDMAPAGPNALGLVAFDIGSRPGLVLLGTGAALRNDSLPGAERLRWTRQGLVTDRPIAVACAALLDADDRPDLVFFTTDAVVAADRPGTSAPTPEARGAAARGKKPGRGPAAAPVSSGMHAWLLRGGSARAEPLQAVPYDVRAVAAFDADGDGDLDLVLGVSAAPGLRLWSNDGGGRFTTEPSTPGLASIPAMRAAVAADFDGDERADIACADELGRWRILLQRPGGSFADVTAQTGIARQPARVLAAADLDADGRTDLLIGNDAGLWVYANQGGARFVPTGAYRVPQTAWSDVRPRGVAVGALLLADLDNDGQEDVVTLQMATVSEAPGAVPAGAAPAAIAGAPGPAAGSEDASPPVPRLGMLQGPSFSRLCVWRDNGLGVLLDVAAQLHVDELPLLTVTPVAADFDQDGDLDLAVVGADSLVQVLWNEGGNGNRRLEVQLVGPCAAARGPAGCVGTRLEMYAGGLAHALELRQQPTWVGVGAHTRLDVLRVTWPDGSVQSLIDVDLPASGRLRLGRGSSGS